ncbi:uncharacterized protein I303_105243 [Kwoniella dejecticola CBS 10117]|uniref:Uncharacterized protein n=1 Tax=Kwoniella dejecticola CBS 10117 TaxID=1296121 RepID=A0A1A6A316_9TREE|nr:uncharacterized protein I303_05310 [Kwoniella dejecticola CBS 10117]OBR84452.1 hypothetical protein I303_05310 [Kwoniella dejecticola CBS 10117]
MPMFYTPTDYKPSVFSVATSPKEDLAGLAPLTCPSSADSHWDSQSDSNSDSDFVKFRKAAEAKHRKDWWRQQARQVRQRRYAQSNPDAHSNAYANTYVDGYEASISSLNASGGHITPTIPTPTPTPISLSGRIHSHQLVKFATPSGSTGWKNPNNGCWSIKDRSGFSISKGSDGGHWILNHPDRNSERFGRGNTLVTFENTRFNKNADDGSFTFVHPDYPLNQAFIFASRDGGLLFQDWKGCFVFVNSKNEVIYGDKPEESMENRKIVNNGNRDQYCTRYADDSSSKDSLAAYKLANEKTADQTVLRLRNNTWTSRFVDAPRTLMVKISRRLA